MNLGAQRLANLMEIRKVQTDLIQGGRINYIDTLRTANTILNEEFLLKDDLLAVALPWWEKFRR